MNKSVTITQCENGFELRVESFNIEYKQQIYIANVIEKSPYDYSLKNVSLAEILKQLFPESVGT